MKRFTKRGARRGFTFIELLAVVLILAVLAGVAIPMYINSRRSAAARACLANIRAIASAQTAYHLRNGAWASETVIVGASEGLAKTAKCPLENTAYAWTEGSANLTIVCPTAAGAAHATVVGTAVQYTTTLTAPAAETVP